MKINALQIKNFRNLKQIDYKPCTRLNILMGNNAQGKTNLLEALYLMATGSSFRTTNDNDLVNYAARGYKINTRYYFNDKYLDTVLTYDREGKKILLLNKKKITKNHPDRLRTVIFTPDDLYLVKGAPAKRRNFLNFILKQVSADYIFLLDNYVKILKKRNQLLKKEQSNSKTFAIINEVFIESAAKIILARINFVNILEETAGSIYQEISNSTQDLKIKYALSFSVKNDRINLDILKQLIDEELKQKYNQEVKRRTTLVGPHLDDVHFYHGDKLARVFASQGQQRNIAVTLKLAEMYTFYKIKGFYPVFLLDEVLAELDEEKKQLLINHLSKADFQTFLTSVKIDKINFYDASISWIDNGCLK